MMILYTSQTGHTAAYAAQLAELLGCEAQPFSKGMAAPDVPVIYMGWVMADSIVGLKQVQKRGFKLRAVVAVGMADRDATAVPRLAAHNPMEAPLYYLQGGYAPERVPAPMRLVIRLMAKTMAKNAASEAERLAAQHMREGFATDDREGIKDVAERVRAL